MKPFNLAERKNKIILFSVMLTITLGLVFLLGTSLVKENNAPAETAVAGNNMLNTEATMLLEYNEKLQAKQTMLQQLDQQYTGSIKDAALAHQSDSLNRLIQLEENAFGNAIENSNLQTASLTHETMKVKFATMLAGYRSALENRRAIASLRNMVAMKSNSFSTDEKAMLAMQDQLMKKNSEIAVLENNIRSISNSKTKTVPTVQNNNSAELMNNIAELKNSMNNLAAANNSLKLENEKLQRQQNENGKNSSSNEAMLKDKAIGLQQKIDNLNAALQLAQVDCNLSRVDAAQIISNAKQRKQLLSEASGILSNLSITANDDLKRKIKDKIVRLNQVASNSRE